MSGARHTVVTAMLAGACLAALATSALAATAVATTPAVAGSITIRGRGFGHGVGMAQDGDLALGKAGQSMPQILGTFYPGTTFGSEPDLPVRVAVLAAAASSRVIVQLPEGGAARSGNSGVVVRPGASVALTHSSHGYDVTLLDPPTSLRADQRSARGPTAYSISSPGPEVVAATGRTYRGTLSVVADGSELRAIDTLPIETYLDGLGEVRDPSWPAASLQALAVAARTYALHSLHPGAIFDVWDDDRSQVYLGASAAYAQLTDAVNATRGLVLTYNRALADTVYSASGGGVTATAAEGFGDSPGAMTNEPYLVAAAYPTANPQPWSVTLPLATAAARLGYPGTMTGMTVSASGPSGRATEVTLTGSAGNVMVTGQAMYDDLDLRSTLYTLVVPKAQRGTPQPSPKTFKAAVAAPPATAAAAASPRSSATPVPVTLAAGPTLSSAISALPRAAPSRRPLVGNRRSLSRAVSVMGLASWLFAAGCCGAAVNGRRHRLRPTRR